MKLPHICLLFLVLCFACSKEGLEPAGEEYPPTLDFVESIRTDKSRYNPGEEVAISMSLKSSDFDSIKVVFKHLTTTISESTVFSNGNQLEISWMPPTTDFRGYSVEFKFIKDKKTVGYASTAVDVSSNWTKFPRYGFLSKFHIQSDESIQDVLEQLNTYHINGLQFYDWHNKHHIPLPMNGNSPQDSWQDIGRRNISFHTVNTYINKAKDFNMASMSYNLLYGAWEDYLVDGVSEKWMIYDDVNHRNVNKHDLDNNWALSDLYVTNPSEEAWQDYIFEKTNDIYQNLDFDGWHLDQLGNRGSVYDYNGNRIDLSKTFTPFLKNLKQRFPDKKMALNAVNQYGQLEILSTPVDFSYTEVWAPNESYADLARIIQENFSLNSNLNTVLAAYVNYGLADNPGSFNDPAVLMTDAVIMSFGGTHIELGEHMLGKEYFPNNNLRMSDNLKTKLVEYYDFMVANQNILRDGGTLNLNPGLKSTQVNVKNWNPTLGTISSFMKEKNGLAVYHLLNFYGLNSLSWRDNTGRQSKPLIKENFKLTIPGKQVKKVTFSSPDWRDGVQKELAFLNTNNGCEVTIPYLEYWGILIVE